MNREIMGIAMILVAIASGSSTLALGNFISTAAQTAIPTITTEGSRDFYFGRPILNFNWGNLTTIPGEQMMTVKAFCRDNTTTSLPFSGGFQVLNASATLPSMRIYGSYGNQTDRSWNVIIHNDDDHPIFVQPEAICIHENLVKPTEQGANNTTTATVAPIP